MEHGVNANLLRKWIDQYREAVSSVHPNIPATRSAFAPVLTLASSQSVDVFLGVTLANGVKLDCGVLI